MISPGAAGCSAAAALPQIEKTAASIAAPAKKRRRVICSPFLVMTLIL
jgi:hypothetical protein